VVDQYIPLKQVTFLACAKAKNGFAEVSNWKEFSIQAAIMIAKLLGAINNGH
jgi:hypothetical protein